MANSTSKSTTDNDFLGIFRFGNDLDEDGSPLAETDAEQAMSAIKQGAVKLVAEVDQLSSSSPSVQWLQTPYVKELLRIHPEFSIPRSTHGTDQRSLSINNLRRHPVLHLGQPSHSATRLIGRIYRPRG